MTFDTIIRGGRVHDGRGGPPRDADIGVREGRIVAVGDLEHASTGAVVDAAGLAVAPGFIDAHTHSDMTCFLGHEHHDLAAAGLRQGVTTEVTGNCGISTFPALPERAADVAEQIETTFAQAADWSTLSGYAAAAEDAGLHGNYAPLVGHGTLRAGVLGFEQREPSRAEWGALEQQTELAFEQGAVGLSSGLVYPPGIYASTDELIRLCRIAARHGRPYTTHIRGETDMVRDAVEEAIEIARAAGAALQISHHKAAGRGNWGRTRETLSIIDAAIASGVDVKMDVYPYTSAMTVLSALLPPWAHAGGTPQLLRRLQEPGERARMRSELEAGLPGWQNLWQAAGPERIWVATCPGAQDVEGRSIADLATAAGSEPDVLLLDLLLDQECQATMVLELMCEEDVERVLAHPATMIGSDGLPLPGKPHPRWAGSFARVLGRYVRERGVLELGSAIAKMTSMPAERFGLRDRGVLEEGRAADIVIFDPGVVIDRAVPDDPLLAPVGVRDTFVNGVAAVRDGALTGARAGRMLRPA